MVDTGHDRFKYYSLHSLQKSIVSHRKKWMHSFSAVAFEPYCVNSRDLKCIFWMICIRKIPMDLWCDDFAPWTKLRTETTHTWMQFILSYKTHTHRPFSKIDSRWSSSDWDWNEKRSKKYFERENCWLTRK